MSRDLTISKGTCFALFAYDVGLSINLTDAERRIIAGAERGRREGGAERLVLRSCVRPSRKMTWEGYVPNR